MVIEKESLHLLTYKILGNLTKWIITHTSQLKVLDDIQLFVCATVRTDTGEGVGA